MSVRTEHSPIPRSAPPASRQSRAPTTDSHLRTILTVGRTAANTPSVRAHIWRPSRAAPTSTTPNDQRAFQMREIDENLPHANGGDGEGPVEDMDLSEEERETLDANERRQQALDYYENQQRIVRPEYSRENYPELMDQTSPIAIRIMIQDLNNNVTLRRNIMVTFETTYPGYGENVLNWAAVSHNMVREPERSFIDAVRARLGNFLMDTDAVQMYTPRPYGTLDMMYVRNRVFAAAREIARENNAQVTMRENVNGTNWIAIYILRNNPRLPAIE